MTVKTVLLKANHIESLISCTCYSLAQVYALMVFRWAACFLPEQRFLEILSFCTDSRTSS